MRLQARSTQNQGIPTASMADIAFLLIIFFMVTINFEVDKTQVYLPKTEIRLEIPKKAAYISITEAGNRTRHPSRLRASEFPRCTSSIASETVSAST